MVQILLDRNKCNNCKICIVKCPVGIFSIRNNEIIVDRQHSDDCLGCLACEYKCPEKAIKILDFQ